MTIFSEGILMFNITTPPDGIPSKTEGELASAAAGSGGREQGAKERDGIANHTILAANSCFLRYRL